VKEVFAMATLYRTAHLPVSPATAWKRIADVGKVHEILPAIVACSLDGDRRSCTFADGGVLHERMISIDDGLMRLAYAITESPFALEFHSAAMQVVADGAGSRILWTTDVKPDAAEAGLAPVFDQFFAQLTERLGAP